MAQKAGLEIRADMKMLRKELSDAMGEFRKFNKAALDAASGVKPLEDQARKAGGALGFLKSTFAQMTGAILGAGAITRVTGWFKQWSREIIGSTSALTELESKAKVVYGNSFPRINELAKSVANEVGRARSQILQFATDFGAVISAFGVAAPLMEEMSTGLAKLAVDMASFHNAADEDAFIALRSGITGETEPLKRFGIVLTDTNLKLFALEKGIKTKVEAMNQAQKTALRYAFIMEKTALAQGDAARTADSFANRTRSLGGEWRNLNEELGKGVTPLLANALGQITQMLQSARTAVQQLTAAFRTLFAMGGALKDSVSKYDPSVLRGTDPRSIVAGKQQAAWTSGAGPLEGVAAREQRRIQEIVSQIDTMPGAQAPGAGGGADAAKKLAEERERAEKEVLSALGEQAKVQLEKVTQEREELMLRKEMGILTADEERRLNRINRRLDFKNEQIEEATKAWRDQVTQIEQVEESIADLNKRIAEERESLASTLKDIDADFADQGVERAAALIKERNELRDKASGTAGMSGDMSRRLGEIEDELRGFSETTLADAEGFSGMTEAEKLDREKQRRIQEATEKSNARQSELNAELAAEQAKLAQVKDAEAEKRKVVIESLNERFAVTTANYKAMEDATRAHVEAMIAEFNRLSAAQNAASSQRFATGGFVSGPGGPTDDKIAAWLSNGEYVINAAATRMYRPILERINSLSFSMPRFAHGGPVSSSDSHDQHISVTQHLHGDAARFAPSPRALRWTLKKFS